MDLILLAIAQFANIFLLGLSSQFVRDQRVAMVFFISWLINASQFIYTRIVPLSQEPVLAYIASSLGASIGIVCSIYFYRWLLPKLKKK